MKKLNLLALVVFVGALVWVYTFNNATTRTIQNRISAFFGAFKKTGANVQDALTGVSEEKMTPEQLRALNSKLAIENAELKIYRSQVEGLQGEVKRLTALLKFDERSPLALIPAKIIVRKTMAWYHGATIDRGSRHGIQEGSPVVVPVKPRPDALEQPALVGRIQRVGENESEIFFITDEQCKVSGRVEGSVFKGMLEDTERLVYSSDTTNRFPPDILLGTVVDFRQGDASSEAIVEPAANLDDLPYVFVLEQKVEAKPAPPPPADPPR
jgi:rod shape-determining protein MreC